LWWFPETKLKKVKVFRRVPLKFFGFSKMCVLVKLTGFYRNKFVLVVSSGGELRLMMRRRNEALR
jgi:hypothetical protein